MTTQRYTDTELVAAFKGALEAGNAAGNARIKELASQPHAKGKMLEACGGSTLSLSVDGRTQLGKALSRIDEPSMRVQKDQGASFILRLAYNLKHNPPVSGQEWSIHHDANQAAAAFIQERLGIEAYALPYVD